MSEQCTAPHMFRQQATAMRSLPGRRIWGEFVGEFVHDDT